MAIDWVNGFVIPLVEITVIGGVSITIIGFIIKAVSNAWNKSIKFFIKYKVKRTKYYLQVFQTSLHTHNHFGKMRIG